MTVKGTYFLQEDSPPAMAHVLALSCHFWSLAVKGLHAGQLIRNHPLLSQFGQTGSVLAQGTDQLHETPWQASNTGETFASYPHALPPLAPFDCLSCVQRRLPGASPGPRSPCLCAECAWRRRQSSCKHRCALASRLLVQDANAAVARFEGRAGFFRYETVEFIRFSDQGVTFEHLRGPFRSCIEWFSFLPLADGAYALEHRGTLPSRRHGGSSL